MVYEGSPGWYVEVYRRARVFRREQWGIRIVRDGNYERLAQGEGYVSYRDALHTARMLAEPAGAKIKVPFSEEDHHA